MAVGEEKRTPLRSPPSGTPIEVIVEGWGFQPTPSKTVARQLDRLVRSGVRRIVSIVPWQGIESDVSHRLSRFLQAAHSRKLAVSLVVSPEVGLNFPLSGVPAELAAKPENQARHAGGRLAIVGLAPKSFPLPSLGSAEFARRYASFIARLDSVLKDLARAQPELVDSLRLITSGSFWKYYRDPRSACQSPYAGLGGDFSETGLHAYSRKLDDFYGALEFAGEAASAAARWKSQALEELNRRWYFQASEDSYRHATATLLKKRFAASGIPIDDREVLAPEADPALAYPQFLERAIGARADARPYSRLIEEFAWRQAHSDFGQVPPVVHWSGLGGFTALSAAEQSFLLLKSLLLAGARGGSTWIPAETWLARGVAFRERLTGLAAAFASGELGVAPRAVTWVPHLWSRTGRLWAEVSQLASEAGVVAAAPLEKVLSDPGLGLVLVDPARIVRKLEMRALMEAAFQGRIVVLPRSPLWSTEAKRELEAGLARGELEQLAELAPFHASTPTLSMRLGKGWLIVHELPKEAAAESRSEWRNLAEGLLRFAGLGPVAQVSNPRIKLIPMRRRGGGLAVFLLNESAQPAQTELSFTEEVSIGDLGASLLRPVDTEERARQFSLQVPAWGVLPLAVEAPSSSAGAWWQSSAQDREEAVIASRMPTLSEEDLSWNV